MLSTTQTTETSLRIKSLDGLRGLAIILVVAFHTYARWPDYIPWVTTHKDFFLFKFGFLGVQLFFIISGFVIYMTLEKCKSFNTFILRRWLRLFPAMLIATIVICATSFYLQERPNGPIQFLDIFSGLLFIEAGLLNKLQHFTEIKAIEGAFWSLFVEVKFYIIFGALYFYKKETALRNLIYLFLASFCLRILQELFPAYIPFVLKKIIFNLLSLPSFGFFAVGALLYKSYSTQNKLIGYSSALLMPLAIIASCGTELPTFFACTIIYCIFLLTLFNKQVATFFSMKTFVFIGFISYPLYLIHENAIVALTIKNHHAFPFIPHFMTPWLAIAIVSFVAFIIANYLEPITRSAIKKLLPT